MASTSGERRGRERSWLKKRVRLEDPNRAETMAAPSPYSLALDILKEQVERQALSLGRTHTATKNGVVLSHTSGVRLHRCPRDNILIALSCLYQFVTYAMEPPCALCQSPAFLKQSCLNSSILSRIDLLNLLQLDRHVVQYTAGFNHRQGEVSIDHEVGSYRSGQDVPQVHA